MLDEVLEKIYNENSEFQTKSFSDFLADMIKTFSYEVRREALENKMIKTIKEWYPEVVAEAEWVGDGGRWIRIYNCPDDRAEEDVIHKKCSDFLDSLNPNYEFDLMINCVNKTTTKEYYTNKLIKRK